MTPAINTVKKFNIEYIIHEYQHDNNCESYGLEAANKLGIESQRVFKTLVVNIDHELVVVIIPVATKLSMKLIAKAHQGKKASMAIKSDVERSTGYVLGGVSPLGQKKRLSTYIDCSARSYTTLFVSAGKRGLELELTPQDLQKMTKATFTNLCQ